MEPPVIRTIRADERDKPDAPDDILHSIWVISLGVRVLGIEPLTHNRCIISHRVSIQAKISGIHTLSNSYRGGIPLSAWIES
jgi:hypothetical protein